MTYLLVTNDFPPKIGGIQNYLWELWRHLPVDNTPVYTTPYAGSAQFDRQQKFKVERSVEPFLLPYPWLRPRIEALVEKHGADLVLLDPALPLGHIGPQLSVPYGVVVHGAELVIPAKVPGLRAPLRRVLGEAAIVVAAGQYVLDEANACVGYELPGVVIPPGVDSRRFAPLIGDSRDRVRRSYDVPVDGVLLASVNRLVPRKGIDVLIKAVAALQERAEFKGRLKLVVGGVGRSKGDLIELATSSGAPVEFAGRLADEAVAELYGSADIMAMLCYDRWFGLEQEGFGIAFLEAAAAGVPQIAGSSGGSGEAVEHDVTGIVMDEPRNVTEVADAIARLIQDDALRTKMGEAARQRARKEFGFERLAADLHESLLRVIADTETL